VGTDGEWQGLARCVGRPDLAGLAFAERQARHDEIDGEITAWTSGRGPQEVMEALQAAGVPAGRVLDSKDIHDDLHLNARGYWVPLPHPRMQPWRQPSGSWRLVEANPHLRRHAPLFGEHNREVLGGLLGLSDQEIAALEAAGIIADEPVNPGVG
jgi:crotonobetainyl-CoA:carnitine CoA-transferase CaiB-like acyl-CoA transferase